MGGAILGLTAAARDRAVPPPAPPRPWGPGSPAGGWRRCSGLSTTWVGERGAAGGSPKLRVGVCVEGGCSLWSGMMAASPRR